MMKQMSFTDRLAFLFGYQRKAVVEQPPAFLQATAVAEQYTIPERTLPQAQLELYQRLSWVQIAVSNMAGIVSTTDFDVGKRQGEDVADIPNHPFELLLAQPNPLQSRAEFLEATVSDYSLTGNAYWWLNKANRNAAPDELWIIQPSKIQPVPDGRLFLRGYLYDAEGGTDPLFLQPWEVCHFKRYHPVNAFVGLSPIEALATVAQSDMNMQKYGANYFDKGNAKPQGALAFADPVDDVAWAKINADVTNQYGGTQRKMMMLRNVGKSGVQWLPMTLSQSDMQFIESRTFTKEEIFSIYAPGLASMLAVNATEANSLAGRKTFIELGVWPNLVRLAEKITNDILPAYGPDLVGAFEDIRITDRAMALQEQSAFERVATVDEVRQKFYQIDPLGDDRGKLLVIEVGKGYTDAQDPADKPPPPVIMPPGANNNAPPETGNGQEPTQDNSEEEAANTKRALKAQAVKAHTSVMVAFFMPPSVVAQLAALQRYLPIASSPVPAGELHMTLMILGDVLGLAEQQATIARALQTFAETMPPIRGRMNGIGRFQAADGPADALYVSFDAKELPEWRQKLVAALKEVGIETPSEHGFTPHITLGYVPADAPSPWIYIQPDEFTLDSLCLAWGDERISWPLNAQPEQAYQDEAKALRKWLKRRPKADPADFAVDYLSDADVKAIVAEVRGVAIEQPFFTKATPKLPGEDGNDEKRAELERYHADKIAAALRRVLRVVAPSGTTPENITPDLAVERYHAAERNLRDAMVEMLMDGAQLGADTGVAQVETLLGVAKAEITGINWDLVNEAVLRWVLGGEGFGGGYLDNIVNDLNQSSERQIRSNVAEWVGNGLPYNVLLDNLERAAFSRRRAETIATTEITRSYAEGNRAAWRESNVVKQMEWRTSEDERVCPVCAPLEGKKADVTGSFGGLMPPAHPRCRCWIVPVATVPIAQPRTIGGFPASLDRLEQVRPLGGSTGAMLVKDPATGNLYVMKKGNNPGHLREEFVADNAYKALGANVPDAKLYETADGPVKLAKFIEGRTLAQVKSDPAAYASALKELRKDFAADALLGNRDVIGQGFDNILVDADGKVWRIDNGGSLRYRAQGQPKEFNQYPLELWTMRNTKINAQTAEVYGGMRYTDLVGQMRAVKGRQDALLKALPDDLQTTMTQRLGIMADLANTGETFLADQWSEAYTDNFSRHWTQIRSAGISARYPERLTHRGVEIFDPTGKPFDNLRGAQSLMSEFSDYLKNNGGDYQVVSHWMGRQASDSWAGAPQATKYFYAAQRGNLDSYYWHRGVETARGHYEGALKAVGKEKFEETFTAWHAFNYDFVRTVEFEKNNRAAGTVQLMRTENEVVMQAYGLKPGQRGVIKRGAVESTSIYEPVRVYGTEMTIQNVPHHRIFGNYFFERNPRSSISPFLGDHENEFVTMMDGLEVEYVKGQ